VHFKCCADPFRTPPQDLLCRSVQSEALRLLLPVRSWDMPDAAKMGSNQLQRGDFCWSWQVKWVCLKMEDPEIPWVSMLKWSKLNWMIWGSPISGNLQMVVDSITIETWGVILVNAFLNLMGTTDRKPPILAKSLVSSRMESWNSMAGD
jgi:hypothetical protein